ncbi:hypothetical protein ABH926_003789 [Catenulispora sp. GP43]|uniref:hypothetical protein n=1 Tax=Catenulispora sp. GP43 TaxID=3156263 RepID=UPI003514007E
MDDPGPPRDRDTCHRLALDHVLSLIAGARWSGHLVLRGSMLMTAYAGSAARKPGDLDFIVVQDGWPVDDLDPYPYVDDLAHVQQWPEVADGAGAGDLWADEEFEAGGQHPRVAPEGLHWIRTGDWEESAPFEDLQRRIRESPQVGAGVVLEAEQFEDSGGWAYADYADYAMRGTRVTVPWRVEGSEVCGKVQMDFAMDEPMPARPRWTRIPRLDGGFSVVLGAGPELSLVWKLMWLMEDSKEGISQGKDLYDAVVLAELAGLREGIRAGGSARAGLRRRDVEGWEVGWESFVAENPEVEGSLEQWKRRLVDALGLA